MRLSLSFALAAAVLLTLPAGAAVAADPNACEAARCDSNTQTSIGSCPCPEASNHGAYVSCVAHAVNKLAKDDAIPNNCRGRIKRCAARSTCGKPGFVTCNIPKFGTCDLTTGTCTEGTSATGTCAADTDCVVEVKCKIKSSDIRCTAAGGTVGTGTSCCADCVAGG